MQFIGIRCSNHPKESINSELILKRPKQCIAKKHIDGKHIATIPPPNSGFNYYNYNHTNSIVLLAIAGPNHECLFADAGSNGRMNDPGIWN